MLFNPVATLISSVLVFSHSWTITYILDYNINHVGITGHPT